MIDAMSPGIAATTPQNHAIAMSAGNAGHALKDNRHRPVVRHNNRTHAAGICSSSNKTVVKSAATTPVRGPGIGDPNKAHEAVIKAITVYVAIATMFVNLLADLLYKAVDPRVQLQSAATPPHPDPRQSSR